MPPNNKKPCCDNTVFLHANQPSDAARQSVNQYGYFVVDAGLRRHFWATHGARDDLIDSLVIA